ncbi:MAG: DMT family transporter [Bacteroidota bacterium]|nr:DMT family transporter [Bacteroidota bacterium]
MSIKINNNAAKWLILIFLSLNWGCSFILIKRGLDAFNGCQVGAIRVVVSFLFLLPFSIYHLKNIELSKWKYLVQVSLIGNGIPAFLYGVAQTKMESSIAGVLNALTPLCALIISLLFFKGKTSLINTLGVILGFIGTLGLLTIGNGIPINDRLFSGLLIVIATIFYAYNINLIKAKLQDMNSMTVASMAFFVIGPPALIYLLSTDFIHILQTNPKGLASFGYVSILAVFGSALALMAYYYLVKITNVIFSSSVTYIVPIIALMWGAADGEIITLQHIIYMFIIFTGIFMVNKNNKKGSKLPILKSKD